MKQNFTYKNIITVILWKSYMQPITEKTSHLDKFSFMAVNTNTFIINKCTFLFESSTKHLPDKTQQKSTGWWSKIEISTSKENCNIEHLNVL